MGNKQKDVSEVQQENKQNENQKAALNRNNFDFLYPIGRGGFGKVWRVSHKKYKTIFALKEMSKAKVIDKRSERSIKAERELLSQLRNPFIVNMHYAFQDMDNLYLVMDLLTGGDMRYHLSKMNHKKMTFNEEQAKFFVACILLALDYTHGNNVLHRDLKPENFVLDSKGYLRLTDYGIAKFFSKENSSETSGTPGYMAPEVMCAQNHTIAVDYFALGVFAFEMMFGFRPYTGKSRSEIKEKILARQVQIKKTDIPEGWTMEAADFINKLIQRKPKNRLGYKGCSEVKDHPWFKNFPWKSLYNKMLESPFKHNILEPWDEKYVNAPDKMGMDTKERYDNIMKTENYKVTFAEYFFYFNQHDPNDKLNSIFKVLPYEYSKLSNGINGNKGNVNSNQEYENDELTERKNMYSSVSSGGLYNKKIDGTAGEIKVASSLDSKLSKIKQMGSSSSENNMIRQYKVSGASTIVYNKALGSTQSNSSLSNNGSKSNIKASVGSHNSTGASNPNQLKSGMK